MTGAADGMLKVWKAGSCKATVKAHSQAIRGKNSEQLVFQALTSPSVAATTYLVFVAFSSSLY